MGYRLEGIMTIPVALGLLLFIPIADPNGSISPFPFGGLAEAQSHKSIALPECEAEIAEGEISPPYDPAFGYYEYARAADGSRMVLMYYYDPQFQYFNENWEEVAPYLEVIKWEREVPHLIGIYLVNEVLRFELWADINNNTALPATDKLIRVREPGPKLQRAPRPQKPTREKQFFGRKEIGK